MGCMKIIQNKHKTNQMAITLKRKMEATIIVSDTLSWPDALSHKVSWRSILRFVNSFLYIIQRGITLKLRKGEHTFFCGTHCLVPIQTSIKYIVKMPWRLFTDGRAARFHNSPAATLTMCAWCKGRNSYVMLVKKYHDLCFVNNIIYFVNA